MLLWIGVFSIISLYVFTLISRGIILTLIAKIFGIPVESLQIGIGKSPIFNFRIQETEVIIYPLLFISQAKISLEGEAKIDNIKRSLFLNLGWMFCSVTIVVLLVTLFINQTKSYHSPDSNMVIARSSGSEKFSAGDKILQLSGKNISNWEEYEAVYNKEKGQFLEVVLERKGVKNALVLNRDYLAPVWIDKVGLVPVFKESKVTFFETLETITGMTVFNQSSYRKVLFPDIMNQGTFQFSRMLKDVLHENLVLTGHFLLIILCLGASFSVGFFSLFVVLTSFKAVHDGVLS